MSDTEKELSPSIDVGNEEREDEIEDLVQWLTDQEQVLLDDNKENGDDDKWTLLSKKFNKFQATVELTFSDQQNFVDKLTKLPQSDPSTDILQRWNNFIGSLINRYKVILNEVTTFEETVVSSTQSLVADGNEALNGIRNIEANFTIVKDTLNSTQELLAELSTQSSFLDKLCHSFKPLHLTSIPHDMTSNILLLAEKEDEDETDRTESPCSKVVLLTERAELLLLECRDLIGRLEGCVEVLSEEVKKNDEKVLQDLEEVEAWLVHVQQILWAEPQRMFDSEGPLTRESSQVEDDDIEEEEIVPELFIEETPSPPIEDDELSPESPPLEESDESPVLPPPIIEYEDDTVATVHLDIDLTKPLPLNKPQDITLDDSDIIVHVEEEVFTPDTPSDVETLFPSELDRPQPPIFDLSEVSANSNIQQDNDDVFYEKVDSQPVDIGQELVGGESVTEEQRSDSYIDEIEAGIKDSEEESCSSQTEDSSLEWINQIVLYEYRHGNGDDNVLGGQDRISYNDLIQQLEIIQSAITIQSHKKDVVISNSAYLESTAKSNDEARELHLRLDSIQMLWQTLQDSVECRIAELKFEWSQTELLSWLREAKAELDMQPKSLLLPEDMLCALENFKSYFKDTDQASLGEKLFITLRNSMEELCECRSEEEERVTRVVTSLEEAVEAICTKIAQQQQSLEESVHLWEEFESVTTPLREWMETVEVNVQGREAYGHSLDEAEQFMRTIVSYRQSLKDQYELLKKTVALGNSIITLVIENTPAYRYIDTVVCSTTQRWEEIVTLLSTTEEELSHVLITWQEYVELYSIARDFIGHIRQMAGKEPVDGSHGDMQLLPKYVQLQNEIDDFKVSFERLDKVKKELIEHEMMGGKDVVDHDMKQLESDWSIVGDVIQGSLDLLWAEHDGWLQQKLHVMTTLVKKGEELMSAELQFIQDYPMVQLLKCDAAELLKKLKEMTTSHEEQLYNLEEKVLETQSELQARHKKATEPAANKDQLQQSLSDNVESVLKKWESIQLTVGTLRPVLQLINAQLELVKGLQEMHEEVCNMGGVTGCRSNLEQKLQEAKLAFSEAKFENLRQANFDLDTIYREFYVSLDKDGQNIPFPLPSNHDVLQVHQELTYQIAALAKSTKDITGHLLLLIEWWKEYEEGSKTYWEWITAIEEQVLDLKERTDEASPNDSLQELLEISQDLVDSVTAKEQLYQSVSTCAQNLVLDFNDKGASANELEKQLNEVKQKWELIHSQLKPLHEQLETEFNQLNEYLQQLCSFSEKLNAVYSEVYDEYCTAIPPNASQETIGKRKMKIQKFTDRLQEMFEEFKILQQTGQKWGYRLIPEQWKEEFREMSPALSDDGSSDSTHSSVGRQLATSEGRLGTMKRMLQERSLDLELCEGNTAVLLKSANELLEWVELNLENNLLLEAPPGELAKLLANKEGLQSLKEEFETRKKLLERLHQLATSSKGSISEVNLKKIETLLTQLDAAWNRMEEAVATTSLSTQEVLTMVEQFEQKCLSYEEWLDEGEKALHDCGPIGADLERLVMQEEILEALNSDILDHKRTPEDLTQEALKIIEVAQEGTGHNLTEQVQTLSERFLAIEERGMEASELCEQAKLAMQDFVEREKLFNNLLTKVKTEFQDLKDKPNRPMGIIQEVLDEHADFCTEVENQSDTFHQMYQFGQQTADTYTPCDPFKQHVTDLFDEWMEFVESLNNRWLELVGLQVYWKQYESKVKEFLGWVMDEAKRFSSEVTSGDGEKGVADHMESCKGLRDALTQKKPTLDEISELADILRPEDGDKPSGTKDVDSRLNDVNMHWGSICQLLQETLEQLTSVYQKLCLINDITERESDWLDQVCRAADNKRPTQGVIEVLQEEIETHKVYLEQIEQHRPVIEIIVTTEAFVLEHTRKSEHDDIIAQVKDIKDRFENLDESEMVYVGNLEESVPLWQEFNNKKVSLFQWVQEAEALYNSDRLRPGNATVTEQNLKNAENLYNDINSHKPDVQNLSAIMKKLARLCLPDDSTFISEQTNQITAHVDTLSDSTEARRELLDTRLQSWQVFPVEEAKDVQDFLDNVAMAIVEDENEEELSGEDLMEKLRQLEELQDAQEAQEVKVSAIDQSGHNEEMQRALAQNPDISKERNNLLQGWSNASSNLSNRLVVLRLRAELTTRFEKAIQACVVSLEEYQTHLSCQKLASPVLLRVHDQWEGKEIECRERCARALESLMQCCHSYQDDPRIQIPKKFSDQVTEIKNKHTSLQQRGIKLTNENTEQIKEWEKYSQVLTGFSEWVGTAKSELSALYLFPVFLTEFLSLTGRFKMLEDSTKDKYNVLQYLQCNFEKHIFFADESSTSNVVSEMAQGNEAENNENNEAVEEELEDDATKTEDDEVVKYRDMFTVAQQRWEFLTSGLASFPEECQPWKEMVTLYGELSGWCEETFDKIEEEKEQLLAIEEEERNPAPFVERFRLMINEHIRLTNSLEDLDSFLKTLVTPDHRDTYGPAKEFVEQCLELRQKWLTLEDTLKHLHDDTGKKACSWEEEACKALTELPLKDNEIQRRERTIRDMENRIKELENERPTPPRTPSPRPHTPVPKQSCKKRCCQLFLFTIFCLVIVSIAFIFLLLNPVIFDSVERYLPDIILASEKITPSMFVPI